MNRLKLWLDLLKPLPMRLIDHGCFGQAKAAAYSFILFFFPLLLFLVTAFVVSDALAALTPQLQQPLRRILPPDAQTLIMDYISTMAESEPTNLLVGASLVMVWTGSGMMATFMEGLDQAYDVTLQRSVVNQRLVAIGLVFLAGFPLVLLAALTIFGSHLERLMTEHLHLALPWFWRLARWGFLLTATMVLISIMYYVGPHRRQQWRYVLPGAALATGLWMLVTLGFSAYVSRFGEYDVIYGSLGAGIVLLIWMYLTALVVLTGGEFNAALETASNLTAESANEKRTER